jgi:predicted nucleic acid-binding protein
MNKEIQWLDPDLYTYDEVVSEIEEHIKKKLYDNDLIPGRGC